MNNTAIKMAAAFATVVVGLVSLHFKVDYAGWVLFVGLLGLLV